MQKWILFNIIILLIMIFPRRIKANGEDNQNLVSKTKSSLETILQTAFLIEDENPLRQDYLSSAT